MRKISLGIFLLLAVCGCAGTSLEKVSPAARFQVGFSTGPSGRVSIDASSGRLGWDDSDEVCLWALDSSSEYQLQEQVFSLSSKIEDRNLGYFTTFLSSPMPDDTYRYFGVSPVPDAVSGTSASFNVPATQDASRVPSILYGRAQWGPLPSIDENYPVNPGALMNLRMGSLLHYLRFFIPEGSDILGEPVTRIRFSMPAPVAGTLTFELGPDSAPAVSSDLLTQGSSAVTLTGLNLVESASAEYALAAIVPPASGYGEGDVMSVTLFGDERYATVEPLVLSGRDFLPGHITSVALRENALHDYYKIRFSLDGNKLGEGVRRLSLTLADGSTWPGSGSSTLEWTAGRQVVEVGESLTLNIEQQSDYLSLDGRTVLVEYESDNAVVSQELVLGIDAASLLSVASLQVPYLFEEDFSNADTGFSINGSLSSTGHNSETLEGSAYGLPGWTASQSAVIAGSTNKALAIRHQNESVILQGTYRGRADSPPMSSLKENSAVKVSVSFTYTGYASGKQTPQLSYGYSLTQGPVSGYYQGGSAAIKGGSLIENIVGEKISAPKDGSVDSVITAVSFTIPSCTSLTRLAWDCYGTKGRLSTTQEWVFIDNIKVQITQ